MDMDGKMQALYEAWDQAQEDAQRRFEAWLAKHTQNGRLPYITASAGGVPGPWVFVPVRPGRPGTIIVRIWMLGTSGTIQGEHEMPVFETDQDWNWVVLDAWCSVVPAERKKLLDMVSNRKPSEKAWDEPVRYGYTKRPAGSTRGWQLTEA